MKFFSRAAIAVALMLVSSTAFGQLTYNESVDGDLSGVFGAPDNLVFDTGLNTISGNIGSNSGTGATNGSDADYFWFSLGAGQVIDLISIDNRVGPGSVSFLGYVEGTAFTGQTASDIDAQELFANGEVLLASDGTGSLFSAPLTEGNHAFWLQETGGATDFTISFNVTSVPEPGSLTILAGLGLVGLARRRRR